MSLNDKNNLKKICSGIGYMVFISAILLYIVPKSLVLITASFHINPLGTITEPIISSLSSLVSLFIVAVIYCKLSSSDMGNLVPMSRVRFGLLIPMVLIILTISFLSSYMADILLDNLSYIGITSKTSTGSEYNTGFSFILQIISVAVIPALVEEFMFRGIILHKLLPYGSTFAIIVSTVLFALLHENIVQIPFAFVGGLAMAFCVVKTKSLLPSIISHFIINFLSVSLDAADYYGIDANLQNALYFILLFVVVFGGILSAYILSDKRSLWKTRTNNFKFKECMSVCFSSVGIIFVGLYLLLRTVLNTL